MVDQMKKFQKISKKITNLDKIFQIKIDLRTSLTLFKKMSSILFDNL